MASNAATSETNAKQSETNAGDYAAVATTAATEAVDAMEQTTSIAQHMESFNIRFEEDPPGSGLFAVPARGLTPDPFNDGLYLIGTW